MTNVVLSKLSANRKSIAFQALFVVVMLALGRFLWIRNQPERVMNIPLTEIGSPISGDNLFMFARESSPASPTSIKARSLHDGTERVISKVDARYDVLGYYGTRVVGRNLTYVVGPHVIPFSGNPGPPAKSVSSTYRVQNIGTFLPPQKGLPGIGATEHKRTRTRQPFLTADVRLQQVPVGGGMSRDVVTVQDYNHICLVGDHVFWIRPGSDELVGVIQEEGDHTRTSWAEVTAHSDLMLTSLIDGTTRCLRHGISRTTSMEAGQAGVALTEPAPFPEPPKLSYIRVSDGSIHSLGTVVQAGGARSFVEVGNRLYWTALISAPVKNEASHYKLMYVSLDGTAIHEVCAQRDRRLIDHLRIYAYRGSLYGILAQTSTTATGDPISEHYLCRLHPERSDPFEILYKADGWFDGGYFYFVRHEAQRGLWATLTNDEAQASYTDTLCRLPLER
jgi:hypothetical protein